MTSTETTEVRAPDPVDWPTARRIARLVAGRDPLSDSYLAASLQADFEALTVHAEELVAEHTGLRAPGNVSARVLDRREWVDSNLTSMRTMLDPLMQRFGARLAHNPLAPMSRRVAAGELGALLGFLSQRVLGQYDLLVPDGADAAEPGMAQRGSHLDGADAAEPGMAQRGSHLDGADAAEPGMAQRGSHLDGADAAEPGIGDAVYYVGANVLGLEKRFAFRPRDFRLWIAIHEVTHRAQFTGVPWMRAHFLGLVRQAFDLVDPDPRTVIRAITKAVDEIRAGRNPLDDGGVVGLFASPEQRGVLSQVQALMSLLEGHGNVVMDDLGSRHVVGQERMSRVLQTRRQQRGITSAIHKVLGLEQKMRQYEVGEKFVRGAMALGGPKAVDAAWEAPGNLPTLAELDAPDRWLFRVSPARAGLGR